MKPIETAIIRIFATDGHIVGLGFLIAESRIITCAHVVADAVGIERDDPNPPSQPISVDFPLVDDNKRCTATLVVWLPSHDGTDDIAVLELHEAAPSSAKPANLVTVDRLWGAEFGVYGFPRYNPKGVWAKGKVSGLIEGKRIQIDALEGNVSYFIEPGFSGSPIYCDDPNINGVIGMAVSAESDPNIKAGFMIPSVVLLTKEDHVIGKQENSEVKPGTGDPHLTTINMSDNKPQPLPHIWKRKMQRRVVYIGKFEEMQPVYQSKRVFVAHHFFGGDTNEMQDYRVFLKDGLEQIGYLPLFARDDSGTLLETICQGIINTEAGIYDVSGYNANVLIELGMSIGLNQPTIVIAQDDKKPLIDPLQQLNPLRYVDRYDLAEHIGQVVKEQIQKYHQSGMSPRFCAACGLDCIARKPRQSPENEYLLIGADPQKDKAIFFHLKKAVKNFNLSWQELEGDFNLTVCQWVEEIKRSKIVFFHSKENGDKRHSGSDNASTMVRTGIAIGLGIAWRMILKQGERMPTDLEGYKYVTWQSSATAFDATLGGAVRTLLSEARPYGGMYDPLVPIEAVEDDQEELTFETPIAVSSQSGINILIWDAHTEDEQFVERLYQDLIEDFDVWWDRVSMPSRSQTFLQEIRDAIDRSDRLLLVTGSRTLTSDNIRGVWEYAYTTNKGINIALRAGDYPDLPEQLRSFNVVDFRDDANYDASVKALRRQLAERTAPVAAFYNVPALPPNLVSLQDTVNALLETILGDLNAPSLISSEKRITTLVGMGGIGKSVLAAAIAHDRKVRFAFPDGIVWLTVGNDAKLYELYRAVGVAFGDDLNNYPDETTARHNAQKALTGKKCLLILDDVWETDVPVAFRDLISATATHLLITTRNTSMAQELNAAVIRLDPLNEDDAIQLLTTGFNNEDIEANLGGLKALAQQAGYLPLALRLMNSQLRQLADRGSLNEAIEKLLQRLPEVESSSPHVFISYSSDDRKFVEQLLSDLTKNHVGVWIDKNIPGGTEWQKTIERGIRDCAVAIIVISESSSKSKFVQEEINLLLDLSKPIIPILIGSPRDIPQQLLTLHYADFTSDYNYGLPRLIEGIRHYLPNQGAKSAVRAENKHIFIAYVRQDASDFSRRLSENLKRADFTAFNDLDSLVPGVEWAKRLREEVERSDIVLCIISPNALRSEWWVKEVAWAFEMSKLIIPILLDGETMPRPSSLPSEIQQLSYLGAVMFRSQEFERDFQHLVVQLQKIEPKLPVANRDSILNRHANFLIAAIQPTPGELEYVYEEVNKLKSKLQDVFSRIQELENVLRDVILFGSISRNTAVSPIWDVDILILLRINPTKQDPKIAFEIVQTALENIYGNKINRRSPSFSSSISVKLPNAWLEISPAAVDERKRIVTPNQIRREWQWVQSNHLIHERYTQQQNEDSSGVYTKMVQLIKWWQNTNAKKGQRYLSGFVLECLVAQAFDARNTQNNLLDEFAHVLQRILQQMKESGELRYVSEIGVPSKRKSTGLNMRKYSEFVDFIEQTMRLIEKAKLSKDATQELLIWREIFGERFPTKL